MEQATRLPSMTIAAFLCGWRRAKSGSAASWRLTNPRWLTCSVHRLLGHLPPGTRLILVGDDAQLPGIGPGIVLHALAGHPMIPQTHLIEVTRQSAASGIPKVAQAIRNHEAPLWDDYHPPAIPRRPKPRVQDGLFDYGVSFIPCTPAELNQAAVRVYEELGGCGHDHSVQLLDLSKTGLGRT